MQTPMYVQEKLSGFHISLFGLCLQYFCFEALQFLLTSWTTLYPVCTHVQLFVFCFDLIGLKKEAMENYHLKKRNMVKMQFMWNLLSHYVFKVVFSAAITCLREVKKLLWLLFSLVQVQVKRTKLQFWTTTNTHQKLLRRFQGS